MISWKIFNTAGFVYINQQEIAANCEKYIRAKDTQVKLRHKIKFYYIPHLTENRLWTGPQVIKTTKFEESKSIMERKICINSLIHHAYP